jgi:hypothetical protein
VTTDLDAALVEAYRATDYLVGDGSGRFILRVGQQSPALARHMQTASASSALFITAYNPYSVQLRAEENEAAHRRLHADLAPLAIQVIEGQGQADQGDWPAERSFLALGIDFEMSRTLGARYKQNAIVWAGADAIPQLILLR